MRKDKPSSLEGVELTFKGEVEGKGKMLKDVAQAELRDTKRSSQVGLLQKGFLEEGTFGLHLRGRNTWISKGWGRMNNIWTFLLGQGGVGRGKGGETCLLNSTSVS